MELRMSSEIEDRDEIKNCWGNSKERNVSLRYSVCRLNDVVGERSPAASLCSRATVRGTARNRDLATNLVEILNDVKAGKTDPAQDDEDGGKLSAHGNDHPYNTGACQGWSRAHRLTASIRAPASPVRPWFERKPARHPRIARALA